ncbi:MAG: glycosyltransferase family 39 protein [Methylococcales bacterium]|nr:glycosyltransferase family 39 protein [Methylococcales bacterium]
MLWTVFTAWVNTAQFTDNIEQYNWAHGLEWGYWKHPPLPTLLLAGVIAVFGNWVYWTYCLSALCFMGTAVFTWKIASKLLGEHAAAVAVILLSLHLGFSWRAQIYNHNTVLLLMVAASVWRVMLAAETKSRIRWGVAGCCVGLALLAKYQAIVPLLGVLFAVQRSGAFKDKENLHGLIFALCAACLIFLPHFFWLWENDFSTYYYAKQSAQNLDAIARVKKAFLFFLFQCRTYLATLITLALTIGYVRFNNKRAIVKDAESNSPYITAWMWGLIGGPAIFLTLMVLLGGIKLESHWGLQTFQFACLWLVWRFKAWIAPISTNYFLIAALLVHVINMGLYYSSYNAKLSQTTQRRVDRIFPAQALANQAALDWQKATDCPLKFVIGSPFEAGLVSLYSGSFPAVLEEGNFKKSPWIKPSEIVRYGYIQVWSKAEDAVEGIIPDGVMVMPWRKHKDNDAQKVYWHITLPQQPCVNAVLIQ